MKFGEPVAERDLQLVAAIFGSGCAAARCLKDAARRRAAGQSVEFRRGTGRYVEYVFVVTMEKMH